MKKRIFYSITGVTLVALCVFSLCISFTMYNQLFESKKTELKQEFTKIKKVLETQDTYDFSQIFTSHRITLIADTGNVLYDNYEDFKKMENHADRPEIIALNGRTYSESTRLSDTLGKQTYYYAEALNDEVFRMAITTDSIYGIVLKNVPFMIIIAIIVIIFCVVISNYLTKKIITPLYNIDEPVYDELDMFYSKIKRQRQKIQKHKLRLQQKTQEFDILTQNIGDGFILLGKNNEIVSINKKAVEVFGTPNTDLIKKDVLEIDHSTNFIEAINSAYTGNSEQVQLILNNKEYVLHISPVIPEEKEVVGVVIIIVDNTEKAQGEKLRREFSANVSHELKTPLTSILGYAELITTGMAKTEDVSNFCTKIHSEAKNLLALIEDIMKISQLDEKEYDSSTESINMQELIETIVSRLTDSAEKKHIHIKTELEKVIITGFERVLDETFYNIIENAIKYNVENGKIDISLFQNNNSACIKIKDTGIGIPPESIDRVFERFYRVDKSHSGIVKGTGLGLSIVKHAVQLHNGTIDVKSEVGKWTEIFITIPY